MSEGPQKLGRKQRTYDWAFNVYHWGLGCFDDLLEFCLSPLSSVTSVSNIDMPRKILHSPIMTMLADGQVNKLWITARDQHPRDTTSKAILDPARSHWLNICLKGLLSSQVVTFGKDWHTSFPGHMPMTAFELFGIGDRGLVPGAPHPYSLSSQPFCTR